MGMRSHADAIRERAAARQEAKRRALGCGGPLNVKQLAETVAELDNPRDYRRSDGQDE